MKSANQHSFPHTCGSLRHRVLLFTAFVFFALPLVHGAQHTAWREMACTTTLSSGAESIVRETPVNFQDHAESSCAICAGLFRTKNTLAGLQSPALQSTAPFTLRDLAPTLHHNTRPYLSSASPRGPPPVA